MRGVIAAIPTPLTEKGEPDMDRLVRHGGWALANGCDGLNLLGTTGEATSLAITQRKAVMTAAANELDPACMMVGTGTTDLPTSVCLTKLAYDLGFAGALVLPPFYYKSIGDAGFWAWYEHLIAATENAPIPIYLYNFPQMTGITFSPALVRQLAAMFPDRIAGAKDSSGDLEYAAELASIDEFDVFPSNEAALARVPTDGFAGCISATVNVTAPLAARLGAEPSNKEIANDVLNWRKTISAQPLIPAVKFLVGRLHNDSGFERVLPPHLALNNQQKASLTGLERTA